MRTIIDQALALLLGELQDRGSGIRGQALDDINYFWIKTIEPL